MFQMKHALDTFKLNYEEVKESENTLMARTKLKEESKKRFKSNWWKGMLAKYGSEEKVLETMRKRGGKGGQAKVTKGFGTNPELARKAGSKGGKKSRK